MSYITFLTSIKKAVESVSRSAIFRESYVAGYSLSSSDSLLSKRIWYGFRMEELNVDVVKKGEQQR